MRSARLLLRHFHLIFDAVTSPSRALLSLSLYGDVKQVSHLIVAGEASVNTSDSSRSVKRCHSIYMDVAPTDVAPTMLLLGPPFILRVCLGPHLSFSKNTPLHMAAKGGSVSTVHALLTLNADVQAVNRE